jgi:hypothetical protein
MNHTEQENVAVVVATAVSPATAAAIDVKQEAVSVEEAPDDGCTPAVKCVEKLFADQQQWCTSANNKRDVAKLNNDAPNEEFIECGNCTRICYTGFCMDCEYSIEDHMFTDPTSRGMTAAQLAAAVPGCKEFRNQTVSFNNSTRCSFCTRDKLEQNTHQRHCVVRYAKVLTPAIFNVWEQDFDTISGNLRSDAAPAAEDPDPEVAKNSPWRRADLFKEHSNGDGSDAFAAYISKYATVVRRPDGAGMADVVPLPPLRAHCRARIQAWLRAASELGGSADEAGASAATPAQIVGAMVSVVVQLATTIFHATSWHTSIPRLYDRMCDKFEDLYIDNAIGKEVDRFQKFCAAVQPIAPTSSSCQKSRLFCKPKNRPGRRVTPDKARRMEEYKEHVEAIRATTREVRGAKMRLRGERPPDHMYHYELAHDGGDRSGGSGGGGKRCGLNSTSFFRGAASRCYQRLNSVIAGQISPNSPNVFRVDVAVNGVDRKGANVTFMVDSIYDGELVEKAARLRDRYARQHPEERATLFCFMYRGIFVHFEQLDVDAGQKIGHALYACCCNMLVNIRALRQMDSPALPAPAALAVASASAVLAPVMRVSPEKRKAGGSGGSGGDQKRLAGAVAAPEAIAAR